MPIRRSLSDRSQPISPGTSLGVATLDDTSRVPTYARGLNLTNRYAPELGVYNMKAGNTRRLRAAIGKVYSLTGTAHFIFPGDSDTDAYDGVFDQLGSWPVIFRNELGLLLGGDGWVKAGNFGTAADPRWTTVGAWTRTPSLWAQSPAAAGATLTLRLTQACTSIVLWWYLGSGPFTVSISGATSGSRFASLNGTATVAWQSTTFTGSFPAGTQMTITTTSSSAIVINGALCTSSVGAHVHNFSQYGFKASDWAITSGWNQAEPLMEQAVAPGVPDCVFYMIGANDKAVPRTDAAIATDITTLRNRYSASDFVLLVPPHPNGIAQATWETYAGSLYQLADTLNCPLIDVRDIIGPYSEANTNGLMADATHVNKAGQREIGFQAAECIGNSLATTVTNAKTALTRTLARNLWR